MRKSRVLCLSVVLVLLIALLAGCGANVSTVMDIDTTDGGFAGSRVITLLIQNDDLSSVTGGITGLETVLTENLPADLTYVISNPSETETAITFTLAFTSMDDYKTKVTNLLALDAENEIVPEIIYENPDTLFRQGLQYTENFQSFDLLRWYFNALQAAEIISESTSNWYELGTDSLVIDGETLDTYGHQFYYDKVEERYLDDCDVCTVMNINGTFDRTITFKADKYTLEDLAEVTDDFEGYMKGVTPEGVTFTTETDDNGYYTTYTYTMIGLTADELVAKTDAILQTEGNTFAVTIQPKEGVAGTAVVTIQEKLDTSYYLDADYDSARSTIVTYPNFTLTEGNASTSYGQSELSYYADAEETYTQTGDWLVGYEKVVLELKASSLNKLTAELTFKASEALTEDIRNIAFSALEAACADNAKFSKDGSTATCIFSGAAEELAAKLDAFVKFYKPAEEGMEIEYSSAYIKEMGTASKFTDGIFGELELNLQPVLGDMNVYITGDGSTDIVSSLSEDENGTYTDTNFTVSFCAVNLNVLNLILTILFALLIVGGGAWGFINRAGFVQWLEVIKEKTKKKPAAPAAAAPAAPAEVTEAPEAAPAEVAAPEAAPAEAAAPEAAPAEAAAPAQAEEEEEDEIL